MNFYFQTIYPLTGKIISQAHVYRYCYCHGYNSTNTGKQHIFMCIPYVTLCAKISYTQITSK